MFLDFSDGQTEVRFKDQYLRDQAPQGGVGISRHLNLTFYYLIFDMMRLVNMFERYLSLGQLT